MADVSSHAEDGGSGPPEDGASAPSTDVDADGPDSPRAALVAALHVRRYARVAIGFGAVFAVLVALFFVFVVSGGRTDFPLSYYPLLAFVVFVTSAMLALAVLVGRRVLRLAVHPAGIVRWSATGGLLAGGAWLVAALGLVVGPGPPWAPLVDVSTPWAALLTPFGLWAVYTRFKRTTALRPVAAGAAVVALVGALVLADVAAFDLVALLDDVGGPVDSAATRLFTVGAAALVGGGSALALLASIGDGPSLPLLALGVAPAVGLGGFVAVGPGRTALVSLAAGLGAGWLLASWRLRQASDADVPADPEPPLGSPD